MGSRLQLLRRAGLVAAGALVLGSAGCALPNGSTGGDPVLGSFNRPIVPTPPPERGGLGLDSPAYDAGARIGLTSPDVPTPVENSGGGMSLPQLTSPSLLSGARLPFGGGADEPFPPQKAGAAGARLPSPHDAPTPRIPVFGRTSPDALAGRPRAAEYSVPGGLAFTAAEPASPIRPVGFETLKDPSKVKTMEDGQSLLQTAGARNQKVEQLDSGDWMFACTVGPKGFEACGKEPLDAMKVVLEQIQKDR
jgi:hypothetical protein